ncbi:MAG TPA: hypothetical protein VF701_21335 [Thermoanaerobaculia bacterium]
MTNALGLVAYLLIPFAGLVVWRLKEVRQLSFDGRLAVSGAAGALIVAVVMGVMSLLGIEWSLARLAVALAVPIIFGLRAAVMLPRGGWNWRSPAVAGVVVVLLVFVYGLMTARTTIGDLLFFWGPKAIHFQQAGGIDVDYLRHPDNFMQHRDYPLLLPLLYAWSMTLSGGFGWWAALILSALCLGGIVAIIRSFARDDLAALLTASVFLWCFVHAYVGGGADPPLLLFETLAVCALVFIRDPRTQTILAAIGLAGAVMVKVEGASFLIAVVLALVVDRRSWKRIVAVIAPAAILLAGWLWFIVSAGLLDTYRGPGEFSLRWFFPVVLGTFKASSFEAFWVPWIAPLAVLMLGKVKRARLPLTIAALSLGSILYVYLKSATDPNVLWIPSSANRVLLTPLLMLLIAAAAAHASWLDETEPRSADAERGSHEAARN